MESYNSLQKIGSDNLLSRLTYFLIYLDGFKILESKLKKIGFNPQVHLDLSASSYVSSRNRASLLLLKSQTWPAKVLNKFQTAHHAPPLLPVPMLTTLQPMHPLLPIKILPTMHLDPPIKMLKKLHHHKPIPTVLTQMLGTNRILIPLTQIPLEVGQLIVNLVINHQHHGQVTRTHQT